MDLRCPQLDTMAEVLNVSVEGDVDAIWPDKLHAKGLAAGCRGRVLPVSATELSPSAIYHAAICLAHLAP